jgi:hypothetical protein
MDSKYPNLLIEWLFLTNPIRDETTELVGAILQGIYSVAFILPSVGLLFKMWQHLDLYSKSMIMIYQVCMTLKFIFYMTEMFVEDDKKYPEGA